jgi:hypothetical protein
MIYYKIRSKKNPDLFRKADGSWNKSGKVYDTLGKLRSTITLNMNSSSSYTREQVRDWEIVEYEVRIKEVKHLVDVIDPKKIFELLGK